MEEKNTEEMYINRELSWLAFNRRVLNLAKDKAVPLGEQLKFAGIYGSNLDEFFMVRVGSLYDRTLLKVTAKENKTGMTPAQQIDAIMPVVRELQAHCDKIIAKLYENIARHGLQKVNFEKLSKKQEHFWKRYFLREIFPVLSPQIIDRRHPFPFLRGGESYVGAMLHEKEGAAASFGLVPLTSQFQEVVFIPGEKGGVEFALTDEMVLHFAELVFGKVRVSARCVFRVTRNADITADEGMFDHDVDYREIMSELLKKRRKLAAVRLQVTAKAPQEIVSYLREKLLLPEKQVFFQTAPLGLSVAFKLSAKLAAENDVSLFYPPKRPMLPPTGFSLAQAVRRSDVLLSYPYQSIRPFVGMLHQAACDPSVISIKMTLYRMAHESKIIEALISAAEHGKEVVAIVELRARFDEQSNIDYSKQLEEAGCTVIYGFEDYKVHSKLTLITRKREGKIEYISQIGTGNYNEKTSEQYTDLSFITADQEIGAELAAVFNNLAVVAPLCFKSVLLKEMDREIEAAHNGRPARIWLKCNSVSDKDIIERISAASCAGIRVRMIVRGICCVKAGVPGLTEHVTVRSIVGRYLEHERVYVFGCGADTRVYIASGDFLTRNTERRVEVGVRIRDTAIKKELLDMLAMQLSDNVNAHEMRSDGSYAKVKPKEGQPRIDSQLGMYAMLEHAWPAAPQPGRPADKKLAVPGARKTKRKERPQKKKKVGMLDVLSALWRR